MHKINKPGRAGTTKQRRFEMVRNCWARTSAGTTLRAPGLAELSCCGGIARASSGSKTRQAAFPPKPTWPSAITSCGTRQHVTLSQLRRGLSVRITREHVKVSGKSDTTEAARPHFNRAVGWAGIARHRTPVRSLFRHAPSSTLQSFTTGTSCPCSSSRQREQSSFRCSPGLSGVKNSLKIRSRLWPFRSHELQAPCSNAHTSVSTQGM